ncbi:MAG: phenylacetate-CoA oxygenase subunit PaaI [Cytophagia bacterium]|nr:phenylacetate-CoA oxygenase subunit PaaI [Cytophagia bacterium]
MNELALKELLYKIADDQLILGHRNSEWTGFGPLLEEDIAFSSMAQDKVGQSYAIYQILNKLGEQEPDTVAFMRNANQFHNSQLVELPNGEYDFSLIRHFLYDTAEMIRFEMLSDSSYEPLAELARKIKGELKYHTLHANIWIKKLGNATEKELIAAGIFAGEASLEKRWKQKVEELLSQTQLQLPDWQSISPVMGGRKGQHTEHLQPLLDEMSEVFRIDPAAEW